MGRQETADQKARRLEREAREEHCRTAMHACRMRLASDLEGAARRGFYP